MSQFVKLEKGCYLPICPCGGQCEKITLYRTNSKISTYCWYCKQYTTRYLKVMEEDLKFTYNWNGKLNCECFTTLRLHNPKKYYLGAIKNVKLQESPKGKAVVIGVQSFLIGQVSEYVARLDTGLSAAECQKMIRTMYKNNPRINWSTQQLDFVLLKYEKSRNEPKLFDNEK